ncbi:hypothetical protein M9H77_09944 [Catharanthus roseus]|uniref:Uncharacterized protein n=1 Tax=Catharanthus roseus TaxID=4058 RepID=A0ACC0C218_CATRO|nr:hypothetical protein M9H77_09944 [Catharanthus roseus]
MLHLKEGHEKEGEFVDQRSNKLWDKFCKLKEQQEHECRTTGAPMPTHHELMLELNKGLKKRHAYSFSAAESIRLRAQSQQVGIGGRPFLDGYEEHMAAISRQERRISYSHHIIHEWAVQNFRCMGLDLSQMPHLEMPPEWRMPDREVGETSGHGGHDGEGEGVRDKEIPPSS